MSDDVELIRQAQGGNLAAFEQLVYKYDRQVLTIAGRFVATADDAKDIYQEVFLRVYRSLRKFKLQSSFTTWLHRITTNVCLTHLARRKRHDHASLDDDEGGDEPGAGLASDDASPLEHASSKELGGRVERALIGLSPQQGTVFRLKVYEELTVREIAVLLKCSEGTVKKHLFTATQRMRNALRDVL